MPPSEPQPSPAGPEPPTAPQREAAPACDSRHPPRVASGQTRTLTDSHWASELGKAVHELLAEIAADGRDTPSTVELLEVAGRHPTARRAAGSRVAMSRNRIAFSLAVYLRHFRLPDAWTLLASGVRDADCELDLVWRHADGRIVADEIKSGAVSMPALDDLEAQIGRQLLAGPRLYGPPFGGVRGLLLRAPGFSRFFSTAGDVMRLEDLSWR